MDYAHALRRRCRPGVEPGYDGLEVVAVSDDGGVEIAFYALLLILPLAALIARRPPLGGRCC